jgi:hypothetical protein
MKLLIAGSRTYSDMGEVRNQMSYWVDRNGFPNEIVSGGCRGVDKMGEEWAAFVGLPVTKFVANWSKNKRAAGPIRNREMAEYCDMAIIFWDQKSRGTKNMIDELRLAKKPYELVLVY